MDRKKVIKGLECCTFILGKRKCNECPYQPDNGCYQLQDDFHAMLKEHETVVKQWTKEIADNQLAHAPNDSHKFMSLDEHLENEYKRGIWDGLQIAWNIIFGRSVK